MPQYPLAKKFRDQNPNFKTKTFAGLQLKFSSLPRKEPSAYLGRRGSKGRDSLWESREELGLAERAKNLNRSEEAAGDTQVCAIPTSLSKSLVRSLSCRICGVFFSDELRIEKEKKEEEDGSS